MRIAFIGGTYYLGPVAVPFLCEAGHEVAIAHTGAHEHPAVENVEHLHGSRAELLGKSGLVESWAPEVLVDTFAPGATSASAEALVACAARSGVRHLVAVSSMDVYQHCVDAGIGDGSGTVSLPAQPIPIGEDALLRTGPYPGGSKVHDNLAMEAELHDAGRVTVLRPGAIYGPYPNTRERYFVERIRDGDRTLKLPDRGQQIFHRVAVERVAGAIVAAVDRAPDGFWACNVVDPYDWTFAGLAAEVARMLEWDWVPVAVPFAEADHPWATAHPIFASDRRLRDVLGVDEPDPLAALERTLRWLWEHRTELPPLPSG